MRESNPRLLLGKQMYYHCTNLAGAEDGSRTHDLRVTNALLYQLSYFGNFRCIIAKGCFDIHLGAKRFAFYYCKCYDFTCSKGLGSWCSWPNTPPCHGGDRRFESGRARHEK